MIIYAYVMGESVAALFLAGIIPGLLVGIGLMIMVRLWQTDTLPPAKRVVQKDMKSNAEFWVFLLVRLNLASLIMSSTNI